MVYPTQLPATGKPTLYVVNPHIIKDHIPDNPQVGTRIRGKVLGLLAKRTYVYVICENIEIGKNWGCGETRWADYTSTKGLRRLCRKCVIKKSKQVFQYHDKIL